MTTSSKPLKSTETKADDAKDPKDTTPVTDDSVESPDVQLADKLGVSEGDVKAARDDAGLNRLAGHEANVKAWEQSEQGKAFLDGESGRVKADKESAAATHKAAEKAADANKKFTEASN